ncbi:MAG: lactate racemase domain-containing protein [Lachnospiraceae bacterium]|nr:lactate racemase domain-containing protein [Lachnospiraceae bacterium]
MSTVTPLIAGQKLPKFVKVKQNFPHNELSEEAIKKLIKDNFEKPEFKNTIKPGMRICITAGSRGLSNIVLITRTVVDCVKELGGEPFIIPAMGSHGGATAEGQRGILRSYNITEESMGCPIISSMETVKIGHAEEIDEDVQIDKNAFGADGIIVMNRIKAHTGFKGKYESGLMKMMTIGLGKQAGAYVAHSQGDDVMPERLFSIGSEIIRKAPVIMGIGLMENAFDKTYRIEFLEPSRIADEEPKLLIDAKANMAKIFLDACDVIILEKIGKNYSGGGMDPNVVGRSRLPIGVKSERMGIWGLSEESHGNATGMGRADVGTMDFFKQISFNDTYPNAITDHDSSVYKIPLIMDNEKECLQACMAICLKMDPENPRIIILKNSLEVESMLISEALIPEAKTRSELSIESDPFELEFDAEGKMLTRY